MIKGLVCWSQIHSGDVQRQSSAIRRIETAGSNKPQTAGQIRSVASDENRGSANGFQPASASQQHSFSRTDSQTSGASRKSEVDNYHSPGGHQTPIGSKPPTAKSRPGTVIRQHSAAETPKSANRADSRPQSSVVPTPKPTTGFSDQLNSERMASSNASRVPTAADRFPKGLPNNAPVILVIGKESFRYWIFWFRFRCSWIQQIGHSW